MSQKFEELNFQTEDKFKGMVKYKSLCAVTFIPQIVKF